MVGGSCAQKGGAVMVYRVWIPGRFSLTNKMLDNLRASEKYHGRRPKGWRDLFAEETAAIRLAAKMAVLRTSGGWPLRESRVPDDVCALAFGVFGHHRHDPDAWYLLGKAVTDGFADAGVIEQDRRDVWETGGRVLQSRDEELLWFLERGGSVGCPEGAGVLVWLSFFERPVGRCSHA
jgi:hypothetical protein